MVQINRSCFRRRAFTLVELLVVLLILSILTVVAVQSTDTLMDQGRFDSTVKSLQGIQSAILGPPSSPSSSVAVSGFVADMGRLPVSLDELLVRGSLPVYQQVGLVGGGWRGPYLRLPFGATALRDGWNNPLDYIPVPPVAPEALPSLKIVSYGADGVANNPQPTDYNADLVQLIAPKDYTAGLVTVQLYEIMDSKIVSLALGAADPMDPMILAETASLEIARVGNGVPAAALVPLTGTSYQEANATMGTIAIRALVKDSAAVLKKQSPWEVIPIIPGTNPVIKLVVVKVTP